MENKLPNIMKCNKCQETFIFNSTFFPVRKDSKYGLRTQCKSCINKNGAKHYSKNKLFLKENSRKKYKLNVNDIKTKTKTRYHKNFTKIQDRVKKYRIKNKEKFIEYLKQYRNKEINKIKERLRHKNKMKKDILYKTSHNIRNLIQKTFKRKNFKKNSSTYKILGCTFEFFKNHIESQFESWMNWNNYGAYNTQGNRTWNIDHIIPIDLAETIEDIIKLNFYMNLRPLCSKENLEKRNNLIVF